jgi:lactoylglutathione lyase
VKLAKDRLDVGLMTQDPTMLDFMREEVGLGAPEVLPVTRAVTQHRFDVDGSVVKVNLVERLDTERRSGYAEVLIADPAAATTRSLAGPDGVTVSIVPPGHDGVDQLGVRLDVRDLAQARHFFSETLGWPVEASRVRLGASVVLLHELESAPGAVEMPVRGWTYLTVQVFDCDAETATAVARGARLARPAVTLGKVARFSMVADPWGNEIEISQRASLTGVPL